MRYRKKAEDENGDGAYFERLVDFRLASTFDVSQSEGEPLPQIAELLDGSVERYGQVMGAIGAVSPMPVEFEEIPEGVGRPSTSLAQGPARPGRRGTGRDACSPCQRRGRGRKKGPGPHGPGSP